MCKISGKIKFCTCDDKEISDLDNYWILHRFIEGKNLYILGVPIMPEYIDEQTDQANKSTLVQRLNETDAFDFALDPKEKDRMEIHLSFPEKDDPGFFTYCFEFNNGKWEAAEYDMFELLNKFNEHDFGSVNNAFNSF